MGVNDVTRVLERMVEAETGCQSNIEAKKSKAPLVPLQVNYFSGCDSFYASA